MDENKKHRHCYMVATTVAQPDFIAVALFCACGAVIQKTVRIGTEG